MNAAFLDYLPVAQGNKPRSEAVRSYLVIAGQALDRVFGQCAPETMAAGAILESR